MNAFLSNYNNDGYVIIKNLISHDLIDSYTEFWLKNHFKNSNFLDRKGWPNSSCFVEYSEIRDVLCDESIYKYLNLINNDLTLSLSFTTWISTRYDWHQDYLNSDKTNAFNHVGVWIALDTISPDSGPFQYIPKSHNWDVDFDYISDRSDPKRLSLYFSQMIEKTKSEIFNFTPEKGDVIFWHGHLVHKGSTPNDENMLRKSLIAHYNIQKSNVEKYKYGQYNNSTNGQVDLYKNRNLPS